MKKLLVLILIFAYSFAIHYTKKEQEFLKKHPVIYFSAMDYWPVDKTGNSFHTNFIKLLNKYGKLDIQPIYYKHWYEGFDAAASGKTYGIMALSYSKKREKYFFYTPIYNYHPYYLIVLKNSPIKSFKDLKGKVVHINKKSIILEKLKNPSFKIVFSKNPYKDLASGKIDAILTFYMPPNNFVKNFRTTKVFIDKTGEEHIGISKKYPQLYSIILKAMNEIPYKEIEKIKEKYYFNPMPPVSILTPTITLKDLIKPIDIFLILFSISILFLLLYLYLTRKYLNIRFRPFLIGIFIIETVILGLIVYEIVMFNYYSKKILEIKSRSFNELFLTDKIEESIIKLDKEFYKKISHKKNEFNSLFLHSKINPDNLKVLGKTLSFYLSPKYFHPATLSKIATIKLLLNDLLKLQKAVLNNKIDISLYRANFYYVLEQLQIVKNYIKNENDKEIFFIKEKIRYQFILLIIITAIFIFINLLLFLIIKKKIYSPIKYLYSTIEKQKRGEKIEKKYFYNDEIGITIKEFFNLQMQLNKIINELQKHKKDLEEKIKVEVEKRMHQEELLLKKSRLELMGEMIEAITHQWKQPISVINYYIYNLKKEKNSKIKEIANNIEIQIKHMVNTLNEFKDFYNISKNKETFCMKEIIDKTLNLVKDELKINKIKINKIIEKNFCIEGNPNEFIHLLLIILSNAKDMFNERNLQNRLINIKAYEDKNFYYLEIEDNAGGINKKIINKIFNLNFTTKENGDGIGLYIANQIAIKHTGILYAKNSKNGARFIFRIRKKG